MEQCIGAYGQRMKVAVGQRIRAYISSLYTGIKSGIH